jgi:four helix bundle protein
METRSFFDLKIWAEAHALDLKIYEITSAFPSDERFGLTAQMRRAANSVSATIAEGTGRNTTKDFINYLYMARGSTHEMMSHISLCKDLCYLKHETAIELVGRYKGLAAGIFACISSLKQKQ